jgi:outer membrane protein assembly factor BamB
VNLSTDKITGNFSIAGSALVERLRIAVNNRTDTLFVLAPDYTSGDTADGHLYALNGTTGRMIYSLSNLSIPGDLSEIAVNPGLDEVYVGGGAKVGTGTYDLLYVLNGSTGGVSGTMTLARGNRALTFMSPPMSMYANPATNHVYMFAYGSLNFSNPAPYATNLTVVDVNISQMAVAHVLSISNYSTSMNARMAFSQGNDAIYLFNPGVLGSQLYGYGLYVINASNDRISRNLTLPSGILPITVAANPVGNDVYLSEIPDSKSGIFLYDFNADTGAVTRLITMNPSVDPDMMLFDQINKRLYTCCDTDNPVIINVMNLSRT